MLKTKSELLANIMAGLSLTSVMANFETILTIFILLTTLAINVKILYDKFKKKKE